MKDTNMKNVCEKYAHRGAYSIRLRLKVLARTLFISSSPDLENFRLNYRRSNVMGLINARGMHGDRLGRSKGGETHFGSWSLENFHVL